MRTRAVVTLFFTLSLLAPVWAQQDATSPDRGPNPMRQAFVTSAEGPPVFGDWPEASKGLVGLQAADSICQNLAAAAFLPNHTGFVAWVSDSDDDAYCRVHNLTGKFESNCSQKALPSAAGPWMRTDGQPWAAAIDQLIGSNGVVYTPLNISELGTPIDTFERAYTASDPVGRLNGDTCSDWQGTPVEAAGTGPVYLTTQSWTNFGSAACNAKGTSNHLYCLETGPGGAPGFARR